MYGNFPYPTVLREAMLEALAAGNAGYGPAHGLEVARAAVAARLSTSNAPLTANDVIMTSGASHALQISFAVLCNPGDNVLLPMPGFSAYQTICQSLGVQCKFYRLDVSCSFVRLCFVVRVTAR